MALTPPQRRALRSVDSDGVTNEGLVYEEGVNNPRLVMRHLVEKGLFARGSWWDEHVGYEYTLTDVGRAVVTEQAS